ncbi:MAG: prenyltransferase [Actinomycetota bacterium]|nr:prenyltransferase [Actinomycetota bacterium]
MQPESAQTLTIAELDSTAETIVSQQLPNGMIVWFPDGHADTWNHIESAMALATVGRRTEAEAAYHWLVDSQNPDGTWHHYYIADGIEDAKIDTNCCAYIAAGVWHDYLLTGDRGFLETMWPTVAKALDFVVGLATVQGHIPWAVHTNGNPWSYSLLTGSSSIYHSLRCGLALAEELGQERVDWELAAVRISDLIANHEDTFEPKTRWAMDWYYPVLSGAIVGDRAIERLAQGAPTFLLGDHGTMCVSDQPWVTTAETCECAIAYLNAGDEAMARRLLDGISELRDTDGAYFTGFVPPEDVYFPDGERSTYSSAAVILAADTIDRRTTASGLFLGETIPSLR